MYIGISLTVVLIVLLVQNIPILFSAYSQETTASADSDPLQKESNTTIKIITFSIICYIVWAIYKRLKYKHAKYRMRQCFTPYVK
jgi:hypothetical protein